MWGAWESKGPSVTCRPPRAPQAWAPTPHLVRGAPPGGRGRARSAARAPCSRQAWLAARHLLPRRLAPRHRTVHPGTCSSLGGRGRTVPAASSPLRHPGPGARCPPAPQGPRGGRWQRRREGAGSPPGPPALPGVAATEPGGSAPVGQAQLGHEQAWGLLLRPRAVAKPLRLQASCRAGAAVREASAGLGVHRLTEASVEHRKQPGATALARGGSGSTRGCQPSGSSPARVPGLAEPG